MKGFSVKSNGIFGFVFLVLLLVGLFFIARGIFTLLSYAAPVLIVGALIINYKTVVNYLKFMLSLLKRNALTGIIAIILSVIGFPILAGILFGKSILDRKVRKLQEAHRTAKEGELVEYEEVIKKRPDDDFELRPLEKEAPPRKDNRYEDLF
ncbi:MAG: hypothetical protein M3R25_10195 [Bacteroidota bacterium]|nr:hypothetical protein [Bacteroidota bacterium]